MPSTSGYVKQEISLLKIFADDDDDTVVAQNMNRKVLVGIGVFFGGVLLVVAISYGLVHALSSKESHDQEASSSEAAEKQRQTNQGK